MLNILPPQNRRSIKLNKDYNYLRQTIAINFVIIAIPALILSISALFLNNINIEAKSFKEAAAQDENSAKMQQEINSFNILLEKSQKIQKQHINPVQTIEKFVNTIPNEGIIIDNLNIDLNSNSITFSGIASNRDSLLELRNSLDNSDTFNDFIYPVNIFSEKENIKFDFTGNIKSKVINNNEN